jgi:hypothetical protein
MREKFLITHLLKARISPYSSTNEVGERSLSDEAQGRPRVELREVRMLA